MLCPRCHLDHPFPAGFAQISSEVLPWDASTGEPAETAEPAGPAGPDTAPGSRVEAVLCFGCCSDLRTMMQVLFPGQLVSVAPLDNDRPPG